MQKNFEIAALGELLIDFTEAGVSASGQRLFEQNAGGAPANLLTAASHMGCRTAFIGKVGADMHGDFLRKTLQAEQIDTSGLLQTDEAFTTLAFVAINEDGERAFSFARKPGADTCLRSAELRKEVVEGCRIFHIGSLSLTNEPARTATYEAVRMAKAAGALISYDPNYRAGLWKNKDAALDSIRGMLPLADLLKVSDEESILLTGEADPRRAAKQLLGLGPKVVAVTLGKDGAALAWKEQIEIVPGFAVPVVDTTGAGDSFWGGFLAQFLAFEKQPEALGREAWTACARIGHAVAALCVQHRGGIPAIPTREAVQRFLADRG